jgi:hypothetical protein
MMIIIIQSNPVIYLDEYIAQRPSTKYVITTKKDKNPNKQGDLCDLE